MTKTLLAMMCVAAMAGCGLPPTGQSGETSESGLIFDGPVTFPPIKLCSSGGVSMSPDVTTDGQRVYLAGTIPDNAKVFLTGYRYNNAPPSSSQPQGDGREAIFCGCTNVLQQGSSDSEFGPLSYFVVPSGAPSGDYSVKVLASNVTCPASGTSSTSCAATGTCIGMQVTPSYVVSTSEKLAFNENSEDGSDSPAEMAFTFAGTAGTAFGEGDMLVEWSGSFPGERYVTNADGSTLNARFPMFVGRESLMANNECVEECSALPAGVVSDCNAECASNLSLGRFNNQLSFGLGGLEYDSSPSKVWGYLAGIAAGALTCYGSVKVGIPKTGCTAAVGVGGYVANAVNDSLANDDDNLGAVDSTSSGGATGTNWNIGNGITGPVKLAGPTRDGGDIDLWYANRRLAAPRILSYKVSVKSMTLLQGYDCESSNEVYLLGRAALNHGETQLPTMKQFPAAPAHWSMNEGTTKTFSPALVIDQAEFAPESAPESPFLYVELAPWEYDDSGDNDSFGIHADTIATADVIGSTVGATEGTTSEGFFTRTKVVDRIAEVNGWQNAESCSIWSGGYDPRAPKGRVRLEYQVELTWLKQIRR